MGSAAQEAFKLWRAVTAGAAPTGDESHHQCPHGWCPACHVADLLVEHPEVVNRVADALIDVARVVVDAAEAAKRQWGTP